MEKNNTSMTIGTPKEIKNNENRVGLTPLSAGELIKNGHKVIVEKCAGLGTGFTDEAYVDVGCTIMATAAEIYAKADMIVKVKEPLKEEYELIREGQIIFTYFHFAASKELTEAMIKNRCICIAYETVQKEDMSLPLLMPMSEIAGKMSVQQAAKCLEAQMGGRGVLLGGVPGVRPGRVMILGGGVVGFNAAKVASGMGAEVVILDININRLRELEKCLPPSCITLYCSTKNIVDELKKADVVIGCILMSGEEAKKLIKKEYLKIMKKRSVIIDVAVDQGGCIETCKPTTLDNPTYVIDDIIHYCVANIPAAVPYTSTVALNNATLQYILQIANLGWIQACIQNKALMHGLNIVEGCVTCEGVSKAHKKNYFSPEEILKKYI